MRKNILMIGLIGLGLVVLAFLGGCGKGESKPAGAGSGSGDPGKVIDQAVVHLNSQQWDKWSELWVPEDREDIRQFLKEQSGDVGLKNVKKAKLVRRVDVTGKVPIDPDYLFVDVRVYYLELNLTVNKEDKIFKNGLNKQMIVMVKKTVDAPWTIRQWGTSPDLPELLKLGKAPEKAPAKEPEKAPAKEPVKEPGKAPAKEPGKAPAK